MIKREFLFECFILWFPVSYQKPQNAEIDQISANIQLESIPHLFYSSHKLLSNENIKSR